LNLPRRLRGHSRTLPQGSLVSKRRRAPERGAPPPSTASRSEADGRFSERNRRTTRIRIAGAITDCSRSQLATPVSRVETISRGGGGLAHVGGGDTTPWMEPRATVPRSGQAARPLHLAGPVDCLGSGALYVAPTRKSDVARRLASCTARTEVAPRRLRPRHPQVSGEGAGRSGAARPGSRARDATHRRLTAAR
jgi:hypothetical protein